MKSFIKAFKEFSFSGRVSSGDFWKFYLISWLFSFLVFIIPVFVEVFLEINCEIIGTVLFWAYSIIIFLPSFSMQVKRLHDTGKSGSWLFFYFLPVIGVIILLLCFAKDGNADDNKYGPIPKTNANEPIEPKSTNEENYVITDNLHEAINKKQTISSDIEPSNDIINETNKNKPKKPISKRFIVVGILLIIALIASAGVNIYQATRYNTLIKENDNLKNSVKRYREQILSKNKEMFELEVKIDSMESEVFFYEYAAVIATNEDGRYHTYDCPYWQSVDGFYVFNPEYASHNGFKPCPYCNPPQ